MILLHITVNIKKKTASTENAIQMDTGTSLYSEMWNEDYRSFFKKLCFEISLL
jgi:hypothetical protein